MNEQVGDTESSNLGTVLGGDLARITRDPANIPYSAIGLAVLNRVSFEDRIVSIRDLRLSTRSVNIPWSAVSRAITNDLTPEGLLLPDRYGGVLEISESGLEYVSRYLEAVPEAYDSVATHFKKFRPNVYKLFEYLVVESKTSEGWLSGGEDNQPIIPSIALAIEASPESLLRTAYDTNLYGWTTVQAYKVGSRDRISNIKLEDLGEEELERIREENIDEIGLMQGAENGKIVTELLSEPILDETIEAMSNEIKKMKFELGLSRDNGLTVEGLSIEQKRGHLEALKAEMHSLEEQLDSRQLITA